MGLGTYLVQKYLSQNQAKPFAQKFVKISRKFCESFENLNYDPFTNGEFRLLKLFDNLLTIYDVGANTGSWTAFARQYHPGAIIHCFDPVPANISAIQARQLRNVIVNSCGLLNQNTEVPFYLHPNTNLCSIYFKDDLSSFMSAHMIKGDDYLQAGTIDFLKIDTEGADHLVLQGFQKALQEKRIKAIQFEYGEINIKTKFLLYDFYLLLTSYGYRIGKIYPSFVDFRAYKPSHENFIGSNYLAIPQD